MAVANTASGEVGGRTGIVVPVPEADPVVERWRLEHDRAAQHGVPAHITLLFWFRPVDAIDEQVLAELADVFAAVRCRPFRLTHVGVFPFVTWLAPEPAEVFRDLTAELVRRFPDCPPYGGAFPDPVPHLTILDHSHDGIDVPDVHAEVLAAITPQLPLTAELTRAQLLVEDAAGDWSVHTDLPFRP